MVEPRGLPAGNGDLGHQVNHGADDLAIKFELRQHSLGIRAAVGVRDVADHICN